MKAYNDVSGITGSSNPLTKQQQGELKSFFNNSTPTDKLNLLVNLHKASEGEPNAYQSMIKSIAGDHFSYMWAASMANRGQPNAAKMIVSGQDLINNKSVKVNEDAAQQVATEYFTGIVPPGSTRFKVYLESATALYAYQAQKGEKITDSSGKINTKTIDKDLFTQALVEVTGGRYFYNGSIFSANKSVLRPFGVSNSSFQSQHEKFNSQYAREYGGSDRDYFLDLPLEQDQNNPNKYYFRNGSRYVMDKNNPEQRLFMMVR